VLQAVENLSVVQAAASFFFKEFSAAAAVTDSISGQPLWLYG